MDYSLPFTSRAQSRLMRLTSHLGQAAFAATPAADSPGDVTDIDVSKTLDAGSDLQADHPGFRDPEYRRRRKMIVELAQKHRFGDPLPRIKYTAAENATWKTVFNKLTNLYPTHACTQYNQSFPLLNFQDHGIPQLDDVSKTLQSRTGWQLRPVGGLLSSRDFLNGLAFRVFHSTQYIRHGSKPLYTPEPDICHELLGHVPMLADPAFAELSHQLGLASIGVSDEDINRLATVYWFSIEFGVLRERSGLRAYGAGLLSSFGELQYSLSGSPEYRPFDPFSACKQEYPITRYQPILYVAESFESASRILKDFGDSLDHSVNNEKVRVK